MGQFLISKQAVNIKTGSGVTASQDKTSIEIRSQFTDSHDWYCSNGIFSWNLKNVTDTNLKINEACSKCSCFVNETGISDSGLRAEYFAYNLTLTLDYPNLIICASYGPPCQQHNVTVRDIKLKNMTSLVILSALRNFPVAALPTMQLLMSDDNHLYFYHLDAQIAFGPSSNSTDLFQYMGKKIPFRSELQSHMREHCASHCRRSEHPNTSPETDTSVELLRYSMDTNLEAETSSEQSTTITTTATATTTTTTTTTHPHTTKAGGDGDEENGSPDRFFACLPLLLFVSVFMLVALNGFCNKRRLCFCRNKKHSKEQDQRDNMRRLIQAASHVPCYQDDGQNFSGHRIRYYLPVPLSFFNNTASDQISALDTLSPLLPGHKGRHVKVLQLQPVVPAEARSNHPCPAKNVS